MKAWVKSWEQWAASRPHDVAVVNADGQAYSFADLSARAWLQEQRFRMLDLASGDRVELTLDRHHQLDDWIVAAWAAGLRRASCFPSWSGFTKRELAAWALREKHQPRVIMDTVTGSEDVIAVPGPALHDVALAWPERALEGGERAQSPIVLREITDHELLHAMKKWQEFVQLSPGESVAVMDGRLSSLSWLSVFATLTHGGRIVQCRRPSYLTSADLGAVVKEHDVSWLCASAEWLAHAGKPPERTPNGVIAPWGRTAPAVRKDWSARCRWVEAWCPASCGWWWGAKEYSEGSKLCLEECVSGVEWELDEKDRYLRVWKLKSGWQPIAQVFRSQDGGLALSCSGVADRHDQRVIDQLIDKLRQNPRFGEVFSGNDWGRPFIAVVPRCANEDPRHVLGEAKSKSEDILLGASTQFHWIAPVSTLPRDECGVFYPRRLLDMLSR